MTITKHVALLLMALSGLTGLLNAQTSTTIETRVPFAFVANGRTIPAGECRVSVVLNGHPLLMISSGNQRIFALPVSDQSLTARNKTAFEFHRYGDRYFLTDIKREGVMGYRLPVSQLERELQARNIPSQEFTLLASAK